MLVQMHTTSPKNAEFRLTPGVMPASNTENLLLLADLRGGIEGRLWLASTVHGAVCVIMFAKDCNTDVLEHECAMWRLLWGRADVRLLRLGGQGDARDAVCGHGD